ncbi:elongation factor 1-beta [Candidatus Woesearchaeota archaeon]|nr:elongation factor 1-beta [Candidatus Woesearchaeota archaeon]
MARVVATIKIMPESPDTDLSSIEEEAREKIRSFSGNDDMKSVQEPIAFGLKALKITFVMDESQGSPDSLEEDLRSIEGVNSVETVDVRRAVG